VNVCDDVLDVDAPADESTDQVNVCDDVLDVDAPADESTDQPAKLVVQAFYVPRKTG